MARNGQRQTCTACMTPLPVSHFREVGKDSRFTICKNCEQFQAKQKQQSAVAEHRRDLMQSFVSNINISRIKLPQTTELAAKMIDQFGGVDDFCKEYKAQVDAANPGTKTKMDGLYSVIKLISMGNEQKGSGLDLSELSDDELQNELLGLTVMLLTDQPELCKDFFESNPELLKAALERTGLKVHSDDDPPDDGEVADVA